MYSLSVLALRNASLTSMSRVNLELTDTLFRRMFNTQRLMRKKIVRRQNGTGLLHVGADVRTRTYPQYNLHTSFAVQK